MSHVQVLVYISPLALHYPYVLAFEPTFVEIRHVETGLLAQIIKGTNLRCLFADTPPSTTNYTAISYGQRGPYGNASYGSRSSVYNQFGVPAQMNPYGRSHGYGRDEIIMVSDDRVMLLRITHPSNDSSSMITLPR